MTLEQIFYKTIVSSELSGTEASKQCVSITDEQMIKFALWIGQESPYNPTNTVDEWMAIMGDREIVTATTSELLAEYKRINNL